MWKLLSAEGYILRKSKAVQIAFLVLLVLAVYLSHNDLVRSNVFEASEALKAAPIFSFWNSILFPIAVCSAVIVSAVVGASLQGEQIQSPLAIGIGRVRVYIAKLLGQFAVCLILLLGATIVNVVFSLLTKTGAFDSLSGMAVFFCSVLLQTWAFAAFFTFLFFTFGKNIWTDVICPTFVFLESGAMLYMAQKESLGKWPLPSGTLMYQYIHFARNDLILTSGFFRTWMPSALMIAGLTALGIGLFAKRDLS